MQIYPLPAGYEWEFGEEAEHPGRWYAVLRWDDHEHRIHNSIRAENEPALAKARASALAEYIHGARRPDLHWQPE